MTKNLSIAPTSTSEDDRTAHVGRIHFGDSQVRVPCIVKQITDSSAELQVFDTGQLPSVFWLSVQELDLLQECQLIEKTKRCATVMFGTSEFHQAKTSEDPFGELSVGRKVGSFQDTEPEMIKPPILWVVEDDEDDQLILADAFRDNNIDCKIKFFNNGVEFLEFIERYQFPDATSLSQIIALIDINMPRMDGISTLSNLRKFSAGRNLPVMMFSTSESDDDIRRAYELGINAYLSKPSTQEDMDLVVQYIANFWKVNVRVSR